MCLTNHYFPLITISILFFYLPAFAQDSLVIQPVGEIRGQKVLYVSGDRMLVEDLEADYEWDPYNNYNREIVLWDMTNPAEPEELLRCLPSLNRPCIDPGWSLRFCSDAELRDTLIFAMTTGYTQRESHVTRGPSDLIIYDIASRETLWHRSFESYYSNFSPGPDDPLVIPVGLMALSGDYLYVAQGMDGISIYDVSDPVNVEEVVNLDFKSDNLVLYNDLLIFTYLPPEGRQDIDLFLAKFDVSDPTNPEELGEVSLNNDNYWWYWDDIELSIWGDYLYLFPFILIQRQQVGFIEIYDINGDEEPRLVRRDEADFMEYTEKYAISEGKVFFKSPYSIKVFDLADPLNPELICLMPDSTGYPNQISAYEDFIYIATPSSEPDPAVRNVRILQFGGPTAIEADDQNQPDNFRLFRRLDN